MDSYSAIVIGRQLLAVVVAISVPILGIGLVVGLVIALFQAVTSLQEQTLSIVPKVLSTARFGEAYTEQLEATGGEAPITWLPDIGRLPDGLTLDIGGAITGTPMEVGSFRFGVTAEDSGAGPQAARSPTAKRMKSERVMGSPWCPDPSR